MLHEFLTANTAEIVVRARTKVAARTSPMPSETELQNGVPLFLSQLIDRLRRSTVDTGEIEQSATGHGGELLAMGFTVSQVVHAYGDICQVVTQLAEETRAPITIEEFRTLNRCLDDAIAHAVSAYERRRDESAAHEGAERLGVLAHELRNHLHAAMLSYRMVQDGTVGVSGSTGAALGLNLRAMSELINRSLADVRLESGLDRRRVSVSALIAEVEVEASMSAAHRGFRLAIAPVAQGIDVEVDPMILSAALGNLLQNAFKFSRPQSLISLRTTVSGGRVLIEIEDQCGGLAPGGAQAMFRPFAQQGADRSGLGLGLSISRKGVEAMGGTLSVRDLPGQGCVFVIELPVLPPR